MGLTLENPGIVVFAVLYGLSVLLFFVASVLAFTAVVVSVWAYDPVLGDRLFEAVEADSLAVWIPFWLCFLFGVAVLTTFFNAALVHEADRAFAGERPSVRSGLRAAWRVRRKVVVWGIVSSVLNTFLIVLEEFQDSRNPAVREAVSLFRAVVEVSWWALTFFVVPVMLFRETSTRGMFATSARTFVDTWGETATASLGIWRLWVVASVLILLASIAGAVVLPSPLDALAAAAGVLGLTVALLVRATTEGVVKAGLWRYATTGTMPGALDDIRWEELFGAADGGDPQRG